MRTSSLAILFSMLLLSLVTLPAVCQTVLPPGTYTITTPMFPDGVDASGNFAPTSFNVEPGGSIGSVAATFGVNMALQGFVNVAGGTIEGQTGILSNSLGPIMISSGSIIGDGGLSIFDRIASDITITGGTLQGGILTITGGNVTISGGSITGPLSGVEYDIGSPNNLWNISGGSIAGGFNGLANVGGPINISGGTFQGGTYGIENQETINIRGGTFIGGQAALANFGGTFNIYGTGLRLVNGFIVGTLEDGQPIDASYYAVNFNGAAPQLNLIVPEGGSLGLLSAGLASIGIGVTRSRRRRRAARSSPILP